MTADSIFNDTCVEMFSYLLAHTGHHHYQSACLLQCSTCPAADLFEVVLSEDEGLLDAVAMVGVSDVIVVAHLVLR